MGKDETTPTLEEYLVDQAKAVKAQRKHIAKSHQDHVDKKYAEDEKKNKGK